MTRDPRPLVADILVAPVATSAERLAARPEAERLAVETGGIELSTCHRVEVYRVTDGHDRGVLAGARRLEGDAVVEHLVGLALGLESAVLAEDQILHQLRTSVATARRRGALPAELDVLAEVALRAGRIARSWRPERPRSLADVALARMETIHGTVAGRTILVVGAGEMGRLAALAAARREARVLVASPTRAHALAVAESVDGESVPFDPGPHAVPADGIVIALGGPWAASEATMAAVGRADVVVDLSMPSALPAAIVAALGRRHVGLDDLAEPGTSSVGLDRYRRRLEALRERTVTEYRERLEQREAAAVAAVLSERIERERAAHLDALWRQLPDLEADDRAAIEGMTRHLARRLFSAPLERLGTDPDGERRRAARELFGL
jgi:glutamyl-tRNA reductase